MKTLINHEIVFLPSSIFISAAVGILNNTNRDSPLVATDFRGGTIHSMAVSSFQLSVFLKQDGA